jgi:hypothetical protein
MAEVKRNHSDQKLMVSWENIFLQLGKNIQEYPSSPLACDE